MRAQIIDEYNINFLRLRFSQLLVFASAYSFSLPENYPMCEMVTTSLGNTNLSNLCMRWVGWLLLCKQVFKNQI